MVTVTVVPIVPTGGAIPWSLQVQPVICHKLFTWQTQWAFPCLNLQCTKVPESEGGNGASGSGSTPQVAPVHKVVPVSIAPVHKPFPVSRVRSSARSPVCNYMALPSHPHVLIFFLPEQNEKYKLNKRVM